MLQLPCAGRCSTGFARVSAQRPNSHGRSPAAELADVLESKSSVLVASLDTAKSLPPAQSSELLRDARLVASVGRILGVGSSSHRVAPKVNVPLRSSWGEFLPVDDLLSSAGFDDKFEASLKFECARQSSMTLLDEARLAGLKDEHAQLLKTELDAGLCVLVYRSVESKDIVRQVFVDTLRLYWDGLVLARVGTWTQEKGIKAQCMLPGKKRLTSQTSRNQMNVIMQTDLAELHLGDVKFTRRDEEAFEKPSPTYGIPTRYTRSVQRAELKSGFNMNNSDFKTYRAADSPIPRTIMGVKEHHRLTLYSWLSDEEMAHLASTEGSELLSDWLQRHTSLFLVDQMCRGASER
eukprot:TRINITY_DN74992_c0_g1_i2.p1 TRINITY_DN74992_c0_g1~~TRINITY_DN74992_c0_g1_i2.p1  ORF type:complete len:366 (-),score=45.83 TRINITY_DN74992_c0_g1_i2:313-1362(-)